ncbi:hypothetical protein CBR_g66662 [Chara braunii]|uniref:Uncharacterized protein n=1 Tax=Chara braunii TaxID=69332 RepID=A0A388JPY9_CHABU|nr:hypothetical protein CBR_g66662 [Chara braunii]|eukprot:GBG59855.1 hypothetical protein CBR_g66662 [Chara braunii]
MVDTRGGKSTTPYTKEQEEKSAGEEGEKGVEAKKQALLEEQAAKKKKREKEMERLKREEDKLKAIEEEEEEEEEDIPLVRNVRRGERGESSGTSKEEKKLAKMVSEWVANFSLRKDENTFMYIPQDKRDVDAEIQALTNPSQWQALEDEKRMEWILRLRRQRRRRIEVATELEKLAATAEQHANALAQGDLQNKVDAIAKSVDVLIRVQQEQMHFSKGHDIALQSIRVGF